MHNKQSLHLALALIAGLFLGTASTGVLAQQDDIYESEVARSTDISGSDLSDADLEAFLHAASQVQSIRTSYAEMMREAEDADERADLRGNAVADMTTAIQFSGIDVETYRAIGYLARNDDEVKDRLDRVAANM